MTLVVRELVDVVQKKAPSATALAVVGRSMGGYGSLLIAQQHPDIAASVACGPSLWHSLGEVTDGAFDDADDFSRNDVLGHAGDLDGGRTRIDCGEDDPFADASAELPRAVPGAACGIHGGYHESPTWRSYVPAQLDFLRTRLPV